MSIRGGLSRNGGQQDGWAVPVGGETDAGGESDGHVRFLNISLFVSCYMVMITYACLLVQVHQHTLTPY